MRAEKIKSILQEILSVGSLKFPDVKSCNQPFILHDCGLRPKIDLNDILEHVCSGAVPVDSIRLIKDRNDISFSTELRNLKKLKLFLNRGGSLVVNHINRYIKSIQIYNDVFAKTTGQPTNCNLYFTPPGQSTLPPHWDCHDVFILQVFGQKRWIVSQPMLLNPIEDIHTYRNFKLQPTAELFDDVLASDSILFMPRGYIHEGFSIAKSPSVHLTFGLLTPTWHEYFSYLCRETIKKLADQDEFRDDFEMNKFSQRNFNKLSQLFIREISKGIHRKNFKAVVHSAERFKK